MRPIKNLRMIQRMWMKWRIRTIYLQWKILKGSQRESCPLSKGIGTIKRHPSLSMSITWQRIILRWLLLKWVSPLRTCLKPPEHKTTKFWEYDKAIGWAATINLTTARNFVVEYIASRIEELEDSGVNHLHCTIRSFGEDSPPKPYCAQRTDRGWPTSRYSHTLSG